MVSLTNHQDHCRATPCRRSSLVLSVSTFHFIDVPEGWPEMSAVPARIRLPVS